MKARRRSWIGLAIIFALISGFLVAAGAPEVPNLINYQGRLTDASGNLLDGAGYSITFNLYSAASGGTALWTETHPNVTVTKGYFSVLLGSIKPLELALFTENPELYLGVTVANDPEMTPRHRLVSVPYALVAGTPVAGARPEIVVPLSLSSHIESHFATGWSGFYPELAVISGINTSDGIGVYGQCKDGYGVYGAAEGVDGVGGHFYAEKGTGLVVRGPQGSYTEIGDPAGGGITVISYDAYALMAEQKSASSSAGAARFEGDVLITSDLEIWGTLKKGAGAFMIDHPLDPENKTLSHSFVESPDMMNVYNGNAMLDENGEAWVELPEWFEALNRDFRYQLTCIGGYAPIYIAEEVSDNRFKIAGGETGMKVSWQVTGIRQDPFANAHRVQVEEKKPEGEIGLYLHPEEWGKPAELGIEYARNPELMSSMPEEEEVVSLVEP